MGYDHDDPSLRTGEGGLTVWTLHKMLQEKRYDELNRLFDNGLTMNSLPIGISAGAGGAAFDRTTFLFPWAPARRPSRLPLLADRHRYRPD